MKNLAIFRIPRCLQATRYTKQGLSLRRNYVCPAFNPPDIQSLLCVLCVFVVYPVQSRRAI
ncbi:MAG: hypothetical protein R6T98_06820 [Desulfatiglandales bacterium]